MGICPRGSGSTRPHKVRSQSLYLWSRFASRGPSFAALFIHFVHPRPLGGPVLQQSSFKGKQVNEIKYRHFEAN